MLHLLLLLAAAPDPTLMLDLGAGITLETVLVEGGTLQQGSPPGEVGRADDETLHRVSVGGFYLGRHPVTRGQFARFVAESRYRTEAEQGSSGGYGLERGALVQGKQYTWRNPGFPQTDAHPVVLVTWDDAIAFTRWLQTRSGRQVRLPSEARFEFAARAGAATRFASGDDEKGALAAGWFKAGAPDGTRPVAGRAPNALGLYDMTGLVYQWCADWYAPYPAGPAADPVQSAAGGDKPRRVLRGGSFLKDVRAGRAAARYRNTPGSRNPDNGFRILVELAAPATAAVPVVTPRPSGAPPAIAVESENSASSILLGLLCLLTGGGLFVGSLVWIARSLLGGRKPGVPGIKSRVDADGFWLELPAAQLGATVNYACRVRGVEHLGSLTAEPGPNGQFVYTGGRPSAIRVTEILAGPGAAPQSAPTPALPPGSRRSGLLSGSTRDDDDDFRGYPSAY